MRTIPRLLGAAALALLLVVLVQYWTDGVPGNKVSLIAGLLQLVATMLPNSSFCGSRQAAFPGKRNPVALSQSSSLTEPEQPPFSIHTCP